MRSFFQLSQYQALLRGAHIDVPKSLEVDFIRLERRVSKSYLDARERDEYSGGSIARELSEALGYSIFEPDEMCDQFTREMVEEELQYCLSYGW